MKTVGQFLKEERIKQKKDLDQISQQTKIRPTILRHIEEGNYDKLPSRTYVQGFVKAYAQALNIDVDKALAFFRREYDVAATDTSSSILPLNQSSVVITPARLLTVIGSVILILFFIFLFIQFRKFAGNPVLLVDYPPEGLVTEQDFVNVSGRTDPNNAILINGEEVNVSDDGTFQIAISLSDGLNSISIVARNSIGRETGVERGVQVILPDE